MRKKGRSELLLLLLSMAVLGLKARIQLTIYFPAEKLTWDEARQYCQDNHIDMVTWDKIDPELLTKWLEEKGLDDVWIGLHEDPEQQSAWKWINVKTGEGLTGEAVSESDNWANGQNHRGSCGSYDSSNKKWYRRDCSETLHFVCYDDNLTLVTENKSWEEALNHCRNLSTESDKCDLLSLTRSSDISYVRDRIYGATSEEVWTGLRFLGGEWWWSDGETLDPQEMPAGCPSRWEHCGSLSKLNTAKWITRD
uniref:C-type lectin domain-containing protein n=1 Tax=Fundulus heteroclitus TaxID=8078 RepID=A0A3Q2PNV4_FUNHE